MRIWSYPPELPLRGRGDRGQLAARLGGLSRRFAEDRRVRRHPLHRRHDQRPDARAVARQTGRAATRCCGHDLDHPLHLRGGGNTALAKEVLPDAVTILGGIHATFMYRQVLSEAPHIDLIVRGDGRRDHRRGDARHRRGSHRRGPPPDQGARLSRRRRDRGHARRAPPSRISMESPPTGRCWNGRNISTCRSACAWPSPTWRAACPFTCSFCSQWKFWRDYRVRDPIAVVDEIENLVNEHDVGFFILADEEAHHQPPQVHQVLRGAESPATCPNACNGASTPASPTSCATRSFCRSTAARALSTCPSAPRAAAQMKLDQFNKETKVADNKEANPPPARGRHLRRGAVHRGVSNNETPETLEENLPDGVGLAARPRQLGHVHALALQRRSSRSWATRSRSSISRNTTSSLPSCGPRRWTARRCWTG